MASQLLDRPTITRILKNSGPIFLSDISIDAMLMACLVQTDVLLHHESESILAEKDPIKQRNDLLSHLKRASPQQFIAFCLVLCDTQNRQDVVTEIFGLRVEDLRNQHTADKMHMAPATKDMGHHSDHTDVASEHHMVTEENDETLKTGVHKSVPPRSQKGGVDTEFSKVDMHTKPVEGPVILSVLGHYKKDPDGIFLLGNLLSEQIKQHIPEAKIIHIVLEDQERIVADGQDAHFIGFIKPEGYPQEIAPSTEWLNFTFKTFYPHLVKHRVSNIITHAPDFIWGAINIKKAFFPKAMILTMIHEQIESIDRYTHEALEKWSTSIEVMVSLGQSIYGDTENLFSCLDKNLKCDNRLCYLPSPPKHFSKGGPWRKPLGNPVITILAGDIKTQQRQKMVLPIVLRAITSVVEELRKAKSVMKLAVRITGIPLQEANELKTSLRQYINHFVALECIEAFSFRELEREMRRSHLCIIPLSSSTLAYGLDFMVPAGFGAPTLVPDSALILSDARDIICDCDQIHLEKVIVEVTYARTKENEESAWKDKIKNILVDMPQAQTSAMALRQAIEDSFVLAQNQHDFIKLLKVPPKLLEQQTLDSDSSKGVAQLVDHGSHPCGHHKECPSSDEQVIKPVNHVGRLVRDWVLIAKLVPPDPVVDVMLEQGSISRTVFEEVYQLEKTSGQYEAMSSLLRLVRKRGERAIKQFCTALRDPTVGFDSMADDLEGKTKHG